MKPSLLIGKETHRDLSDLLHKEGSLVISGAGNETAKAMLIAHFRSFQVRPTLLLAEDMEQAQTLRHWLGFFGEKVELVEESADGSIDVSFLQRFLLFMQGEPGITVITRKVWEQDVPLYRELAGQSVTLKVDQHVDFTRFIEDIVERGYEHAEETILTPGQYRRTGDTLDIFPVQSLAPYRIQFAFDAIEKIERMEGDYESPKMITEKSVHLLPLAYAEVAPLSRQFPEEALLVIDDLDDIEGADQGMLLRFTSFPESQENHAHLRYLSVLKFYTLTDFLNDVRDKLQQDWSLVVVTRRADELEGILKEERIGFLHKERKPGAITLVAAEEGDLLPHSIQNPDLNCALLTDREIFTLRKSGKERSVQKLALDFLTSLSAGDFVVHMEHGIGRFQGMTQKSVDNVTREYLELEYAEGDKLFTPVDQADKLSKYVHEEGQEPVLTRLGASDWKKVTDKIKAETKEIAKDLLQLYAKRANAKGYRFPEDDDVMKKFEESFPYAETPGQHKAIEDIKRDMEDDHPMDRLVCGDVGFGKTEVAMRAAFKAVRGGKQVAVIAPITILVDQHFHNFQARMKPFGVRIEVMSRFRSAKEQSATLERLRKGDCDIVIGTHRLLQEDVAFFNLGILIIDEEQRFGVKQKEKFKEMRASVDILTLTATPIPRTLNLGLHKLRDITTITTPPPGRLPIITEVRKYSDALVRTAVQHEIDRSGQCFILHNRVETIDAFAQKLRSQMPKVSFVVAHGQLRPEDLEERILAFKEGKFQVLVSSTIIENGIDLPRANTLIVNEAEKFGLAQLYQLRGRVGRSKVQAYAYLLYHTQRLHDDAKKRLRAIVEACELGSGFQVAMRDLEIRGAGEILGVSQAGTMNTVGISHYLRMLKSAVEELRSGKSGEQEEEVQSVEILLPVEALIPTFYIPDSGEKISVYQKLAGCEEESVLAEFETDLKEEYGELPRTVQNLFAVLRLKLACRAAGVVRIKAEDRARKERDIVLTLSPRVEAMDIMRILSAHHQWKISSNTLRIAETDLQKKAGQQDYLAELTAHVQCLIRPRPKKATKKDVED